MLDVLLMELPGSSAQILRWLRAPGEAVTAGEPLLIVLTDRVEATVPAPSTGTLSEVLVASGNSAAFGEVLARIEAAQPAQPDQAVAPPAAADATPEQASATPRATPLARRIATLHNIDLAALQGSGASGRICKADVMAWLQATQTDPETAPASSAPLHPVPATSDGPLFAPTIPKNLPPLPALQATHIALPSTPDLPTALTAMQVNMSAVMAYVAEHGVGFARRGLSLTPIAAVAYAAAAVLPQHPLLNAAWSDDGIVLRRRMHLGVELAASDGMLHQLLVPDAGDLTLRGIARALATPKAEQIERATLTLREVKTWWAIPTLGPDQSAALGVGAVVRQPVVYNDGIVVAPMLLLTLAYDARVLGQCQADAFLNDLRQHLEGLSYQP